MFWVQPPFPVSELKFKTIKFRIPVKLPEEAKPVLMDGTGTISVHESNNNEVLLDIWTRSRDGKSSMKISLPDALAKQIKRQEKGGQNHYILNAERSQTKAIGS
jgi:hypothetical protein